MSLAITKPSQWRPRGKKRNNSIKFLSDLPFSVRHKISKSMDSGPHPGYARLAGCLGYSQLDIANFALEFKKMDGSPMMALFHDWESRNPTMACVFRYFNMAERYLEMDILKRFVPENYRSEVPNNSDAIDVDAMFDSDDKDDAAGGKDVKPDLNENESKKLPEEWKGRPGMPRENSWDDESNDHPNEKRKISGEFDGSSINADPKVSENKLSPTAPPIQDLDKIKGLSLDTKKDSMSTGQCPNSLEKCTDPPMSSGSGSPDKACSQEPSLKNENGTNGSKDHQAKLVKLSFATVHSFLYEELKAGTNNWSKSCKIGEGSFGEVFMVNNLGNTSTTFAVKRMKPSGALGIPEKSSEKFDHFITEITESRKYNHKNLILISGYALGPELCIVYEYMSKGSLMDNLKCKGDLKPLLWKDRIAILRGAARGLNYLHVLDEKRPLIHGDIKSDNILLNQHFEPKISDLGLAKHALRANEMGEYTHVTLDNTYMHRNSAYLPKSFVQHPTLKRLSIKTDVHCFGVVIMETLTGLEAKTRKPFSQSMQLDLLVDIVHDCKDRTERLRLLDRKPSDFYPGELLDDLFKLAMKCTSDKKKEQPCMKEVLEAIKDIEKRKVDIDGKIRQGVRLEKSAPPAVKNNPLDVQLIRHIDRQQAIMTTSRPDQSLQLQQSFQPGIPSFNAGPAASGYSKSLPVRTQQTSAAPSGGMSHYQYSLRSDTSDSVDMYQSSESMKCSSGMRQFQGVVGGNTPRTPLPLEDCSVPLPTTNCPQTHGKIRTVTGINHVPPGRKSLDNGDQQQLHGHPPDNRQERRSPRYVSLPAMNENSPNNEHVKCSLPSKLNDEVQQQISPSLVNRQDIHQQNFRPTGAKSLPVMKNDKPAGSEPTSYSLPPNALPPTQGQFPSAGDSHCEAPPGRKARHQCEISEQEILEIKRKKPLSFLSDVSDGLFPFPDEYESIDGEDQHEEEEWDEDEDANKQLPSLPPGLSRLPTFQINPPRACEESDERDGHISVSDDDMVVPIAQPGISVPPPGGADKMNREGGENQLTQEFETITLSSLSDNGEHESLTSPPAIYREPTS